MSQYAMTAWQGAAAQAALATGSPYGVVEWMSPAEQLAAGLPG